MPYFTDLIALFVASGTLAFLSYQAINLNEQLKLSKSIDRMQKTLDIINKGTTPQYINYLLILEDELCYLSRYDMIEKFNLNRECRIAVESIFYYFESLSDLYHQDLIHKKFIRMRIGDTSMQAYGFLNNYILDSRKLTYEEINPEAPQDVKDNVPLSNFAISWELMNADMVGNIDRQNEILDELEEEILKRKEK